MEAGRSPIDEREGNEAVQLHALIESVAGRLTALLY